MVTDDSVPQQASVADAATSPDRRPSRRRWLLPISVLAGLLIGGGLVSIGVTVLQGGGVAVLSGDDGPRRVVRNQDPAPPFALADVRGGEPEVTLSRFRGRPVVVNFWASWCVPCRREMPVLAALHRRVGDRVAFVGVNHQDGRAAAERFADDVGVEYPSGFDPGGDVARSYGLFGIPTTVFISPDGEILEQRTGEMSRRELERTLRRVFGLTL